MKIPKIINAVGLIDDDLIAAALVTSEVSVSKRKRPFVKWAVLAASLAVVILAGAIVLPMMLGGDDVLPQSNRNTVLFGDLERNYKTQNAIGEEIAIDWPDKYLSAVEKHSRIIWSFKEYSTMQMPVATEHLGDKLGNYLGFEVRKIKGIDPEHAIALRIEDVYYNYRCYQGFDKIPATLGELFDLYNLSEVMELDRFTEHERREETYYALTDDDYIIEVLSSCRDAKLYADGDRWEMRDEYLSFTMTSDALGVYKKAMYITKDGYLWTNMFEYAYIYEIGTEAAGKIIDYAIANSTEKETYEPYEYRLAGTLTKIEDGYAYIDDSVMCVDPDEGMVFRVSMEDIRIRRCIEYAGVGEGDFVVVTFRGGIDLEDGNLILDARSIEEAYLSDGGAVVPE